jgi:hypothetical protein
MKMKYLGMLIAMAIVNTSCTDLLISYPYDYYDDYNYDYNYDYNVGYYQGRVDEKKAQYIKEAKKDKEWSKIINTDNLKKNDPWDSIIKVERKPDKYVYRYGRKYNLVETDRTYNYYKGRRYLYRYIDSYDDTYESNVDLGYSIYRNGRVMTLELFRNEYNGKFYVIDDYYR